MATEFETIESTADDIAAVGIAIARTRHAGSRPKHLGDGNRPRRKRQLPDETTARAESKDIAFRLVAATDGTLRIRTANRSILTEVTCGDPDQPTGPYYDPPDPPPLP